MKLGNVLITGGCGFIGGHLVDKLITKAAKVTVIDTFIDPRSVFAKKKLKKQVELYPVDVRHQKKIFSVFKKLKPSYIIHLAAQTLVNRAYENPTETLHTNILGTVNVLEATRIYGAEGLIVASSDKAYGKSKKTYTENFPLQGDHPYDVSKSSADLISQAYYKTYKTPVIVTRFCNVYGEGDLHFSRIIPGICEAIIKTKTLSIRSDGKHVRDYLYIKDVVNDYISLFSLFPKYSGETFNFSSGDTLSVLEIIKTIERVTKKKISYEILNTAINEIPYQHLNDIKIRKLGRKTKHSVATTIKNIIAWYQDVL